MKDIVQFLKLPPSILAAIALGTGLVLFLPSSILIKIGLDNIPQLWKTIIGIAFIISLSITLIFLGIMILTSIISRINETRFKWNFPKAMAKLRQEEWRIVVLLYMSYNYTSRLPHTDGVTLRLQSKGIIQITARNSIAYGDSMNIPYTITPIAQNYLDRHQEYLKNFEKTDMQNLYDSLNNPFGMYNT